MIIEFELVALGRLFLAMVLCGVLGYERESTGKAAGLRTHILVGMGAGLFVILGHFLVREFAQYGDTQRSDPVRILEAVAAGVSFLGAGTIVFARGAERVRGLTTAASLWTTAGVGMAACLGKYVLAVGMTLILLIVLRVLLWVEGKEVRPPKT